MANNNLFGGLGSLGNLGGVLGGIVGSVVPKDTPEGKLLAAGTELADLQKQERDLLLEIGRQAYEQNPSAWPQDAKLQLIRQNIASAQATLDAAKSETEAAKAAKEAEDAKGRCPSCGYSNPDGVKFCQECGGKLGATFCKQCGAQLQPGTRFCGECGANQES